MQIDFYFDPVCPWCWITSRWLIEVADHRDLEIRWRSFSVFKKNDVQPRDRGFERYGSTHKALRVVEAVRAEVGGGVIGALYTEYGRRRHHDDEQPIDLAAALEATGLDPAFATAAEDDSWDSAIEQSMKDALAVAGDDVGVPLMVFDGERGFFGPVISPAPQGQEAVELFDNVSAIAALDGFWELKRIRNVPPQFADRP